MAAQVRIPVMNVEKLTTRLAEIKARKGDPPGSEVVAQTDEFKITSIYQAPGHKNDYHYHTNGEC